jgi:hypothetical protein
MFVRKNFLLITVLLAVVFAVTMQATVYQKDAPAPAAPQTGKAQFRAYWHGGRAEISRYTLEMAFDGRLCPGQATLIAQPEDFDAEQQVRAETAKSRNRSVSVLKTNLIQTFSAGMADYSLQTSVFTPIDEPAFPYTLKVSTSVQSWDGTNYLQLNYRSAGYQVNGRGYTELEGAEAFALPRALPEDELWNRIRLNPAKLPTGDVTLIPGTASARLRHHAPDLQPATATLTEYVGTTFAGPGLKRYSLEYEKDGRTLSIVFTDAFPHQIQGWEETITTRGKRLTTRAVRQKTMQSDYWNHTAPADSSLRL